MFQSAFLSKQLDGSYAVWIRLGDSDGQFASFPTLDGAIGFIRHVASELPERGENPDWNNGWVA